MKAHTTNIARRAWENAEMASLLVLSRALSEVLCVQDLALISDYAGSLARWMSPLRAKPDTLVRGSHLAYRWSRRIPGANCLHRATATRVWLGTYRVPSKIVLGFRKNDGLQGHAWLEVPVEGASMLLFVSDEDGYEAIAYPGANWRAAGATVQ